MKKVTVIIFIFLTNGLFSQTETEIISVNTSHYGTSSYLDNDYLEDTYKYDVTVLYGHDVGKKSKLFYYASYENFYFHHLHSENLIVYPKLQIPSYEIFSLATGMTNTLKNNWSLTNFGTYTLVDDFKHENLDRTAFYRSFSFLTKKRNDYFKYSFGVYTSKIGNDFSILPIIILNYQKEKYGAKLFFPRNLKIWHRVNDKSYISLFSKLDLNLLDYKQVEVTNKTFSLISQLNYNYIINKKIKLKAGVGLPFRTHTYNYDNKELKTNQVGGFSFNAGISYVVFQDERKDKKNKS